MSVYVDDVQHRFGNMIMCHMWADTLPELLAMVDQIGVQRKWLQTPPKASWVAAGAILTDMFGPAEHVAKLTGNTKRLEQIAYSRSLRK